MPRNRVPSSTGVVALPFNSKRPKRREAESSHCYNHRHAQCSGRVFKNHGIFLTCDCACHTNKLRGPMTAKKKVEQKKPRLMNSAPLVVTPRLPTLTSWSYSVYTQYVKCPLSICFDKIKRIRITEPENPAFIKGNAVHKFAEQYIAGALPAKPIMKELQAVKERLSLYRKVKAAVEQDWAFTKAWLPTVWNDWDNCWLRIKVDVCAVTPATKTAPPLVQITDWKSGRVYDDHKQQRSLYALGALTLIDLGRLADGNKDAQVVAEHLYTDTTQSATEEYTMKDLRPLKREWLTRISQMMSDVRYPARTGSHCRYCRFRKSAGGPCPENQ